MVVHETVIGAVDWLKANPTALRAAGIAAVWFVTVLFVRMNGRFFRALDDRIKVWQLSSRTHHHLDRLADTFAIMLAVLVTLGIMGVGQALWGALTALGVAGIIIGFAAKDLVANLFAGFVILFDQPFMPGDSIEVAGQGGTVETVSLRSTVLATWDGRKVTLPNATFISNSVINYTANATRRVDAQVAILNESDVDRAMEVLQEVGEQAPLGRKQEGVSVRINEVREYAIHLEMRFWVKREDLIAARTAALRDITRRFREEGIDLAVPLRRTFTMDAPAAVDAAPPPDAQPPS